MADFLELFIAPVRRERDIEANHWIIILAGPDGVDCTFYHFIRRPGPTPWTYDVLDVQENQRLNSGLVAEGVAIPVKIHTIPAFMAREVYRVAEISIQRSFYNKQPYPRTFLEGLEAEYLVPLGTADKYQLG